MWNIDLYSPCTSQNHHSNFFPKMTFPWNTGVHLPLVAMFPVKQYCGCTLLQSDSKTLFRPE